MGRAVSGCRLHRGGNSAHPTQFNTAQKLLHCGSILGSVYDARTEAQPGIHTGIAYMVRGGKNPARSFCKLPSRTGRGCVERYDESKSDGESGITALKPLLPRLHFSLCHPDLNCLVPGGRSNTFIAKRP